MNQSQHSMSAERSENMNSFKHTPGPWSLKADLGIPLQILGAPTEKDPRYNPVTRCGTTFISPSSPEAMADAMLISAAPELLESVHTLAWVLTHLCDAADIDLDTRIVLKSKDGAELGAKTLQEIIDTAAERMTKATGEEWAP